MIANDPNQSIRFRSCQAVCFMTGAGGRHFQTMRVNEMASGMICIPNAHLQPHVSETHPPNKAPEADPAPNSKLTYP
jgi:hypothetical protein